ncbi:zinc-binding dehydrogenase [Microbacterium gorillae]|uniref:zinc-binding dehydrogenase n=1 Tax=Microbacterium gorillae TaxID=1231063 RepID=UPI003D9720ED
MRLTSYSGGAQDLPTDALERYLRAIEAGTMKIVVANLYNGLDRVATAHRDLEVGGHPGKRVVVLDAA